MTSNGDLVSSKEDLKRFVISYFQELFAENTQAGISSDWPNLFNHRSSALNESLNADIMEEEVKQAIFSIEALRAPSQDGGLLAMFYHRYWEFYSNEVAKLVRNCFRAIKMPKGLNATLVTLISKGLSLSLYTPFLSELCSE